MIFETLAFLLSTTPLADEPPVRQLELASKNVIADGKPAIASFACNADAVEFQLRWPVPFDSPSVNVGVGSGGEMDAAMGPSKHWDILAQAEHRVLTPPFPTAEIVTASGDNEYLLLLVEAPGAPGTAEFKASDVKALFDEAVERCRRVN